MNRRNWGPTLAGLAGGLVLLFGLVSVAVGAEAPAQEVMEEGVKGLGNSKPVAFLFWLLAGATLGGSLFVITRRNMISAVMGMVGTFFCLAALYAMLYAHFIAIIQILVYAGAIMVLFVFVVMILNRAEDQPWALKGLVGKGIAGLALAYLLFRVAQVLWTVTDRAPAEIASPQLTGYTAEFGSTKAIGQILFTKYLFPFEAVSIVLLIAVVGAIAVARPAVLAHAQDEGEEEEGQE